MERERKEAEEKARKEAEERALAARLERERIEREEQEKAEREGKERVERERKEKVAARGGVRGVRGTRASMRGTRSVQGGTRSVSFSSFSGFLLIFFTQGSMTGRPSSSSTNAPRISSGKIQSKLPKSSVTPTGLPNRGS
jgi:hypothetical protein